jgi:hypothetical protein
MMGLRIEVSISILEFFGENEAQPHRDEDKLQRDHLAAFLDFSGDKVCQYE